MTTIIQGSHETFYGSYRPNTGSASIGGTALRALAAVAALAGEMSFLDHLEELRKRLLWSVAVLIAV